MLRTSGANTLRFMDRTKAVKTSMDRINESALLPASFTKIRERRPMLAKQTKGRKEEIEKRAEYHCPAGKSTLFFFCNRN
jgi:hypothetical protein